MLHAERVAPLPEASETDLLQTGAALVVPAARGAIRVTGPDRASWLQGLLTNDIEALTPGRGCYAAWLTPQGRMITDAVVLAGDDALTLEVPRPLVDTVARALGAAVFAEDVVIEDTSTTWAWLGVHGPSAAAVVARVLAATGQESSPPPFDGWPEFSHVPLDDGGALARRDAYGVAGCELRVAAAGLDHWISRLRLAGAVLTPAAALEFARIEAGRPEFLVDMDADTIPLEAGLEQRAISFTKGCYVGQEVIVRVLHRGGGRVAKRLVGLVFDDACVPAARAPVSAGGSDAGRVTSAAWSPRLSRPVALAYVRRDLAEPGTAVQVACGGESATAAVRAFPLA